MRFLKSSLGILGGIVILMSSAAISYAGPSASVPEMDSASLCIIGIAVGGYLVHVSKLRRK
jgi:hypothetical protein